MNRSQTDLASTRIGKQIDRAEQPSELVTGQEVGATGPDFCEALVHDYSEHDN